jgi:hypothetical protein
MGLLHDLDDGNQREITQEDFEYFLEVLPPVAMPLHWHGQRWSFGFTEGHDYIYAFKKEAGKYYAQKTDLLNPHECSMPSERQQGFLDRLQQQKEATADSVEKRRERGY